MESVSGGDSVRDTDIMETEGEMFTYSETIDYSEQFAQITYSINETNKFLYKAVDRIDFLTALILAIVISAVVYTILKTFTRF